MDGSAEMVKSKFSDVVLIENKENLGFAAANAQAYRQCKGDYIYLVNPDAVVLNDAFQVARAFMDDTPECGICGGKVLDTTGNTVPSARRFPNAWYKFLMISGLSDRYRHIKFFGNGDYKWFDYNSTIEVDWVPGAFFCIRKAMLDEIGFLDKRFFLYYEETDLCLRAKQNGWKVMFVPQIIITHEGGASSKTVKDKLFDQGSAQIVKFRMLAECLYFRKNYGCLSVLSNMGIELLWHALRWIVNLIRPHRQLKRQNAAALMALIMASLRETRFGKISPEKPWK